MNTEVYEVVFQWSLAGDRLGPLKGMRLEKGYDLIVGGSACRSLNFWMLSCVWWRTSPILLVEVWHGQNGVLQQFSCQLLIHGLKLER